MSRSLIWGSRLIWFIDWKTKCFMMMLSHYGIIISKGFSHQKGMEMILQFWTIFFSYILRRNRSDSRRQSRNATRHTYINISIPTQALMMLGASGWVAMDAWLVTSLVFNSSVLFVRLVVTRNFRSFDKFSFTIIIIPSLVFPIMKSA